MINALEPLLLRGLTITSNISDERSRYSYLMSSISVELPVIMINMLVAYDWETLSVSIVLAGNIANKGNRAKRPL